MSGSFKWPTVEDYQRKLANRIVPLHSDRPSACRVLCRPDKFSALEAKGGSLLSVASYISVEERKVKESVGCVCIAHITLEGSDPESDNRSLSPFRVTPSTGESFVYSNGRRIGEWTLEQLRPTHYSLTLYDVRGHSYVFWEQTVTPATFHSYVHNRTVDLFSEWQDGGDDRNAQNINIALEVTSSSSPSLPPRFTPCRPLYTKTFSRTARRDVEKKTKAIVDPIIHTMTYLKHMISGDTKDCHKTPFTQKCFDLLHSRGVHFPPEFLGRSASPPSSSSSTSLSKSKARRERARRKRSEADTLSIPKTIHSSSSSSSSHLPFSSFFFLFTSR